MFVRIDDYPLFHPQGDPRVGYDALERIGATFNARGVPFIVGVIPRSIPYSGLERLCRALGNSGKAVLHGYSHAFEREPWEERAMIMPEGGEFSYKATQQISDEYRRGDAMLRDACGALYDSEHYVAPFNAYNEKLLTVLRSNHVQFLHTLDVDCEKFHYPATDHYGIQTVIARYERGYNFAHKICERLRAGETLESLGQITLHWCYDLRYPKWEQYYADLATRLADAMRAKA